jgi:preprotein translocase subunit YajC
VTFATTAQYYMVPTFFAIMIILTVFAFVLYRDNDKALKQKRKDSVLGFISKEKD